MKLTALASVALVTAIWLGTSADVAAQSHLARAREAYNAGNFDAAIQLAAGPRNQPRTAASAALIIARARLERFRASASPADLSAARTELVTLNTHALSQHELLEWQIGLAQTLYFENELGPASDWFRTLIPSVREELPPAETDKLLEWWATTTSASAEALSGAARTEKYREVLAMMELELESNPMSRAGTYWIAVAARGAGDLNRAWNAAVAGWIRARGVAGGQQLRADLERFVLHTLIPERAQMRSGQRIDNKATAAEIAALTDEWRNLTRRWDANSIKN